MKCLDISGGDLRTLVEFARYVETDDGHGGRTAVLTVMASARGRLEYTGGSERLEGQRLQSVAQYRLTVRASRAAGVVATDAVIADGNVYAIRSMGDPEAGRGRWVQMSLERGAHP